MYKNFILTESEKEEILNMHKSYGYKNVVNEAVAEEPVIAFKRSKLLGVFSFDEGKTTPTTYRSKPITQSLVNYLVNKVANDLKMSGAIDTLQKFRNSPDFRIPQFIEIHLGTSQTGSGETNSAIANGRRKYLENFLALVFRQIGVDASVAKAVIMNKPETTYAPSQIDRNFYDPKLSKPKAEERMAWIIIKPLQTQGNTTKEIQGVQKGLNQSSSFINGLFIDNVDEKEIVNYMSKLQTFSDVEDLNDAIIAGGKFDSLEGFLNDQLFNDPYEMDTIRKILQGCAMKSGKQKDTVRLVGGKISIGIGR
jgi:hypothetical protein